MTDKLQVKSLRKTYSGVVALDSATIDLKEGEFLTLLGPSGSGKTTLLTLIAGLTQPDSGEIRIDGRLVTYLPPHQRDLGMVFQNYALFPHLTVFDNIAFPLRMRRLDEVEVAKRVKEALASVQLPAVAGRLPRELSGGQQQRIALARCIVYQPSIILMDEPLGALDKKLRDHMQLEIKNLHTELGITVLYVTHDQEEAMVMSDRICLMNDGKIVQLGTPHDLYFRPETKFAANFLGESNILPARVVSVSGREAALTAAGGATIYAACDGPLAVGDDIFFMVRPEDIRIAEDAETDQNALDLVVRDAIVAGAVTKLYGTLKDGQTASITQLTKRSASRFAKGSTVRIHWSPENTVLLSQ